MCNLYAMTKGQQAIRELFDIAHDRTGNLPLLDGIYPDYPAPVVKSGADGRELVMARWGLPSPAFALEGRRTDPGVTNVRNTASPHWRRWLGPANRCLVPFTAFSEPERRADGRSQPVWFAFGEDRPLACFAGLWVGGWRSTRKLKEGDVTADLYAFLTTDPNAEVGAVHPKAMPVILTTAEEHDLWLRGDWADARGLQRPLPDGALTIVGRGGRQDGASERDAGGGDTGARLL